MKTRSDSGSVVLKNVLPPSQGSSTAPYSAVLTKELSKFIKLEVITSSPNLFKNIRGIHFKSIPLTRHINNLGVFMAQQWFWMNYEYNQHDIILAVNQFEVLPFVRFKQIAVIHDLVPLIFPKEYGSYRYYHTVLPVAAKSATHIVAPSENTKRDIMRFFNIHEAKITVIHCGPGFMSAELPVDEISDHAQSDRGAIEDRYILYIGGQSYHKNLIRLLQSYNILKNKCDLKLVIIGTPHPRITPLLLEYCKSNDLQNRVVFTGIVNNAELIAFYKKAMLFVFPSLYEGFGLPPLEAMSLGVPVVASRASCIPEVCGDAAYYVDPYDIMDITNKINEVLTNHELRNDLIRKGFERVKLFSWEKTAEKFLKLLQIIA